MARRYPLYVALSTLALLLASGACKDEEISPLGGGGAGGQGTGGATTQATGTGGGGPTDKWPNLACDPLVPERCGFPFPSNVYTVPDAATPTGRRISLLPDFFPPSEDGYKPASNPWNQADGFSPGSALLAYLPGAVDTGLVKADQVEDTLLSSSRTVLVDMTNNELVPHWAEVDHSTAELDQRAILIHPAVPLVDGTRYAVAIQGIETADGTVIAPSPAFAALRDGSASSDPSVEARRGLYGEIFASLGAAGVPQAGLQLAWDFTTASKENNTGWLLHMREEAGLDDPTSPVAYTITNVVTDLDPNIAFAVHGTMTVPLYLDQPGPGGRLIFGSDGMPEPNATTPTYEVEWELLIPQSALTTPAKLLQYGHGLLGSYTQIERDHFYTLANNFGYAVFSVNMDGMAEDDEPWIVAQIVDGKTDELAGMTDRLHQGHLNALMAMRAMAVGMDQDPTYGAYIDGGQRFYWGISQGGIMGGVTMAVSTDITSGILEVMGQPYNTLLNRSVDFDPFFGVLNAAFPDARDQQIFLALVQMLWDRVEPNGYTKYAVGPDKLPGSPEDRRILMRVALGDHQVTTYGGQVMARAMNAKHFTTGLRDVWGLEPVNTPVDEPGATYFEIDFGLPPEPLCNVPMTSCEDPHGKLRSLDEARAQAHAFFTTGVASITCPAGVCSFPALSGCTGTEDTDLCD